MVVLPPPPSDGSDLAGRRLILPTVCPQTKPAPSERVFFMHHFSIPNLEPGTLNLELGTSNVPLHELISSFMPNVSPLHELALLYLAMAQSGDADLSYAER